MYMGTYEKMEQLLRQRMEEMLLNGVSPFDIVDTLLGDMTMDVHHNLYSAKDMKEISHPYKRDYGHYFLDKI